MDYNIKDYMYLVDVIIKKKHYNGRLFKQKLNIDKEDLIQIGMIGLIKGFNTFNKNKSELKTHLASNINYELLMAYRESSYLISFSRDVKNIGAKCINLELENIKDIMENFNCSENIAKQSLIYKEHEILSFDKKVLDKDNSFVDLFKSNFNLEDYTIRKIEFEERLSLLNENQKEILLYTLKGKTQREIAKILNVSQKTVHKHLNNALDKIKKFNEEEEKIA